MLFEFITRTALGQDGW